MSRFNPIFKQTALQKRCAYIPFLMLGYPNIELCITIIEEVIKGGADALELGIPFSDPIADGPTIQQAAKIARDQGVTPSACFKIINHIRQQHPTLPIGLLVYANLVFHEGLTDFYNKAYLAGVDAVLIPDVPTQEAKPFVQAAKSSHIQPILLATPACRQQDIEQLASLSEGFTYVVTRKGVTGTERQSEFDEARKIVNMLKSVNAPPAVFGFGLKNPDDIKMAYQHGASGAIVGSALIDAITPLSAKTIQDGFTISKLMKNLFNQNVI